MLTTPQRRSLITIAAVYAVGVAAVVFVPGPVDAGMGYLFGALRDVVPWATQHRVQVAANVLLFIPAGFFLCTMLPSHARHGALPAIIVAAVTVETIQAELLPARDGDIHDIIANVTGGSIGVVLAAAISVAQRRRQEKESVS